MATFRVRVAEAGAGGVSGRTLRGSARNSPLAKNASPKQCTTDEWRQALSPVRQANLKALFCRFYEARSSGPRKTSAFCESAMSAKSANCGASFLLAFLKNASAILEAADDLRGAMARRSLGSRRGAAKGCVPSRGVGTSRLNYQRTADGHSCLTEPAVETMSTMASSGWEA